MKTKLYKTVVFILQLNINSVGGQISQNQLIDYINCILLFQFKNEMSRCINEKVIAGFLNCNYFERVNCKGDFLQ